MVNVPYFRVRACSCWMLSYFVTESQPIQSLHICAVRICAVGCRWPTTWTLYHICLPAGSWDTATQAQRRKDDVLIWSDMPSMCCHLLPAPHAPRTLIGVVQCNHAEALHHLRSLWHKKSILRSHWYCPGSFIVEHLDKFVFRQVFASDMVRSLGFLRENWSR